MKGLKALAAAVLAGCSSPAGGHWHGPLFVGDGDRILVRPSPEPDRVVQVFDRRDAEARGGGGSPEAVAAAFPRRLSDRDECGAHGSLEEAREAGEVRPEVEGSVRGSFTGPGRDQVLYTIRVGECGADGSNNWGSRIAAVFEAGRLVRTFDVPGLATRAVDLDGDGADEITAVDRRCADGLCEADAWVVRGDGSTVLKVAGAYRSCRPGGPGRTAWKVVSVRTSAGRTEPGEIQRWGPCE